MEKNKIIGGAAGGFYYRGIHLELGCNILGPAGKGKSLSRFLDYFEIERDVNLQMLQPDSAVRFCSGEEVITLPAGVENYVRAVAERFPEDSSEILNFGALVRSMVGNLRLFNLDRYFEMSPDAEMHTLMSTDSVADRLKNVKSALARELLSLFWRFTGTPPSQCPMSLYAPVMSSFLEGPCSMSGEDLSQCLGKKIKDHGGRIEILSNVSKMAVDSNGVRGVEIKDKEFIEADLVVSTIHPLDTMNLLDDQARVKRVKRRLEQAGETCGAFVSYFLPVEENVEETRELRWNLILGEGGAEGTENVGIDDIEDLDMSVFAAKPHRSSPEVIRAQVLLPNDIFSKWAHTKTRKRGMEYKIMKNRLAFKMKEKIEATISEHASGLRPLTSVTSLTFRDELGHRGGVYGVLRSSRLRGLGTCNWRTPVKGLLLGGHSVFFPGIMGTMETSFLVGTAIFGEEHMVKKFQLL